ncbi:MAG: ATP-dependent RNA helicase dbp7 [Thelocarpon superellum]|nr:MAG: ATP-dependent RNA helicase dbp7 [Thelocarpon superellum]
MKLKNPTSIQKATISQLIKDDSDAFVQAETGSGKTLAYLLPIVQRIMDISRQPHETAVDGDGRLHRDSGLFAIILAPTRELCKQISVVLESVLRCAHWIVAGTVIGGEKKKSEKARLRKGLNILVATPGRLADHLDHTKVLDVSRVRWLVLDEGDRLMELGFEEELQGIVAKLGQRSRFSRLPHHPESPLPDRRVTVLCSATLKLNVQRLGEISLKDAVHLKADPSEETSEGARSGGDSDDNFTAPLQLKQSYAVVPAKLRLVTLVAVLRRAFYRRGSVTKAVVFISCADSVDFHFELFTRPASQEGSTATATATTATTSPAPALSSPENLVTLHRLHGSLTQPVRTSTLSAFKNSKTASVLICTDVASRGLDLPNVDLVVEYDPPFNPDDHLHRVGRTARAGRDGRAIIFLMPGDEEGYVSVLHHRHQREGGPSGVARHDSPELLKKGFGSTGPGGGRDWDERATEWQLDAERWALDHPRYLEMARRAFQSHVRAYATHVASERAMFSIKSLHLGHLAKSFALREKPGSIQGPSQRTKGDSKGGTQRAGGGVRGGTHVTATATPSQRRDSRGGDRTALGAASTTADADAAAKKMRAKMKEHMSSISEFNIG